jgi:hypothetical protein
MQQPLLARTGLVRMYHGTGKRFERFSLEFAARPTMSGNGHLGVWMAVDRALAERFGKVCLDVDVLVQQPYIMPLGELSKLNDQVRRITTELDDEDARVAERQFYTQRRTELRAQGYDIIYLEEVGGRVEMAIGLEPSRLTIQ